jgi:3-deoxy-D-arabino-heptulosonate 7-phosphate (DAHP) synthase
VYPNPSNGETNVMINAIYASKADVKVLNSIGQVVYVSTESLNQGENLIKLDASRFAHGVYSIVVESEHGKVVKKLTVTE